MLVVASIDKNVTYEDSIYYLKDIGILTHTEERLIYKKERTLYIEVEMKESKNSKELNSFKAGNVYINIINEKGISFFSIADKDSLRCFIPINNILSISIRK